MTIRSVKQRSRRADFNAVAALRAVKPATIVADDSVSPTATRLDRVFTHPLIAHTRTSLAENAALRIVSYDRRQIFFGMIVLLLGEAFFESTPIEGHLLQFAFAATIANWAIEWMIGEQKLRHATLRLLDFFALRSYNHAVRARDGAGRLQLRHLVDPHQAHTTRCL